MAEYMNSGNVTAESEFQNGLTGACGPNACASAARWANATNADTTVTMTAALQKVVNSPNGVSTLGELRSMMNNSGYSTLGQSSGQSALDFCRANAGRNVAIVVFYTAAQALKDYITGAGMDASGLQGHFNCYHGYNSGGVSPHFNNASVPEGFICADGDNNVQNPVVNGARQHLGINTKMVYYTAANASAAGIAAAFAVQPRKAGPMVPQGWTDDGITLRDPAGHGITMGFRQMVLNWPGGWESWNWALTANDDNLPNGVEYANKTIGGGTRRLFRGRALGWSPTFNNGQPYVIWVGVELGAREQQVNQLQDDVTAATTQNGQLQGQITKLTDQVDTLEQQISNQPAPLDTAPIIADLKDALVKLGG
jgi:hypothetical protein